MELAESAPKALADCDGVTALPVPKQPLVGMKRSAAAMIAD
jgi:hypothetical protein